MDPVQAAPFRALIDETFREHGQVLAATVTQLAGPLERAARLFVDTYRQGGKAILFGNGGSMSDALHVEGELVNRFHHDRPGLPAVALSSPASFTATANDYAYQDVFARMLVAHARPGDLAVGFSTSGNSENVVRAFRAAKEQGLASLAFTGEGGGRCRELADVCLMVPSRNTPRIQEMHITMGHMLCDFVERALFPRA